MKNENYILTYYQSITDGTITVGKWIKLVYEYIVNGLHSKLFFYVSSLLLAAPPAHLCYTFCLKQTAVFQRYINGSFCLK